MKNSLKIILPLLFIAVATVFAYFVLFKKEAVKDIIADLPAKKENSVADQLAKENISTTQTAQQDAFIPVPPINKMDHAIGGQDPSVQVIVYSDFECEFCAQLNADLARLRQEYPEQVAVAFRHYPLRSHANAYAAALASECADLHGKFWEMHDALYGANATGTLGIIGYGELAVGLGMDGQEITACVDEAKFARKVQGDLETGNAAGVTGVPALFINGRPYAGALPYDDFTDSQGVAREGLRKIVERELSGVD